MHENLHVLSCFVLLKSVLLIPCVFWKDSTVSVQDVWDRENAQLTQLRPHFNQNTPVARANGCTVLRTHVRVCIRSCVCVCERERERQTDRQTDRQADKQTDNQTDGERARERKRERERERLCVCVRVFVYVRLRNIFVI